MTASYPADARDPRPLHDIARYDRLSLIATADKLLNEPQHLLRIPAGDLLDLADNPRGLAAYVKGKVGAGPTVFESMPKMGGPSSGSGAEDSMRSAARAVTAVIGFGAKKARANYKINQMLGLMRSFELARPVLSLTEQERGLFLAMVERVADKQTTPARWKRFLALLIWNGGKTALTPTTRADASHMAAVYVREFVSVVAPDHAMFLAEAGAECAHAAANGTASPVAMQALSRGSKWMDDSDLAKTKTFSATRTPSSLILGSLGSPGRSRTLYYDHHESMITIANSGGGKSQAHVITNLLNYPGSAIVLDVKGELYQTTAEYRFKNFGPVYRFAPTDPSGNTDRYNPLDLVRKDPDGAADDLSVLSYQIIVENPRLHDPYWENKGRDFLWAFGMMVSLLVEDEHRKLETLYELLSLQTESDAESPIMNAAARMRALGEEHNIPDLVSAANALRSGLQSGEHSHRIESVLDTGRRYLSGFARSSFSRHALSASDWRPETFREQPGSTLYICLNSNELKAYGAIVRLMLAQHALKLLITPPRSPDDPPVTFFLDEMPQLGNFDFVRLLQDLGRSAKVRIWMFSQTMGHITEAFGPEVQSSIIGSARVQSFMRFDPDMSDYLQKPLGDVRNLFNGENRPLATPSELMGPAFAGKMIVMAKGERPMLLDPIFALQAFSDRMVPPLSVDTARAARKSSATVP